jgi:MFS family permease
MGGRFVWASASDWLGRKNTYFIFFALGAVLYWFVPHFAETGKVALFVMAYCVILSMYGGGFATVPAYLADIFGTAFVGGIHGRLLTAWAAAGIAGPVLVNYIRAYQVAHGFVGAQAYTMTLHVMAGLLVLGFLCNLLVRAVDARHHMRDAAVSAVSAGNGH